MATPIEDPKSLPGKSVHDQERNKVGPIKDLYTVGGDGEPMWVTVQIGDSLTSKRSVFVPLARLKQERDEILVPYTTQHLLESPEVGAEDELSKHDDTALRNYYAIGLADQEIRSDNESYAAQVPDGDDAPRRASSDG